jgi:hypothetical protein
LNTREEVKKMEGEGKPPPFLPPLHLIGFLQKAEVQSLSLDNKEMQHMKEANR